MCVRLCLTLGVDVRCYIVLHYYILYYTLLLYITIIHILYYIILFSSSVLSSHSSSFPFPSSSPLICLPLLLIPFLFFSDLSSFPSLSISLFFSSFHPNPDLIQSIRVGIWIYLLILSTQQFSPRTN